ncbi:protein of unknown function [Legionella pneumophila subsp. pneumophila]|uniref:Uncharacterized protein n=1 Tax=Legionella pneumophila subsp. pneumophila TaxID=91891 RepID=A0AAV2V029_LEGPN|nr:protein of unknown function [Legionella pneumophila subsp. pneumophila]
MTLSSSAIIAADANITSAIHIPVKHDKNRLIIYSSHTISDIEIKLIYKQIVLMRNTVLRFTPS